MALEAVVFPQDLFGCAMKDLFGFGELGEYLSCYDFAQDQDQDQDQKQKLEWDMSMLPSSASASVLPTIDVTMENRGVVEEEEEEEENEKKTAATTTTTTTATTARPAAAERKKKRQRTRSCKNKEEVENQRMTHIAVERNRRKLMNEYLAVLRSIMPTSYVQRGDQASIVGGAINFVKELEQLLQSLDAQRRLKLMMSTTHPNGNGSSSSSSSSPSSSSPSPFSDFFAFPQYCSSTRPPQCANGGGTATVSAAAEATAKKHSSVADIEVTMVESHANLKVLSRRRPKQLLKMVVGLQNLRLTTLHLNVTTVEQMVLYSFSLKLEDDCHFTSVDDIATAVHHIVVEIQKKIDRI